MPFDIVLVVVDALRRDSLGTFNATYRFTPELDRRLATWYRLKHCYTSAPWTLPAILEPSGVSASRHGRFFQVLLAVAARGRTDRVAIIPRSGTH